MTQLRKRVLEELERRNYSQATARAYVGAIRRFAEYFHRSPDQLGLEHIREYQLHLVQERKLLPRTRPHPDVRAPLLLPQGPEAAATIATTYPCPKLLRYQIPTVLSADEVARLIDAASNLRHRTILMTLYSTGMRRAELCHLRPKTSTRNAWSFTSAKARAARIATFRSAGIYSNNFGPTTARCGQKSGWLFPSLQTRRPISR